MAALLDEARGVPASSQSPSKAHNETRKDVRRLLEQEEDPVEFMARMSLPEETQHSLQSLQAHRADQQAERSLRRASRRRHSERLSRESTESDISDRTDSPNFRPRRGGERHSV